MGVTVMPMVLAFQFTPLREGRQLLPGSVRQPYYFNSRPSARGDHGDGAVIANFVQFQFTPLREGRQGGCTRNHFFKIFQFTPLREGRPIWVLMDLQQANFNSRPSARGDDALQQAEAAGVISIHAPPRGATLTDVQRHVIEAISIHAPPRGATGFKREYGYYQLFQFTPLREGRPDEKCGNRTEEVFQFTPLREGRQPHMRYTCLKKISIHAPPRGATCQGAVQKIKPPFQFTPLREGRREDRKKLMNRISISIHAPPRGATCCRRAIRLQRRISIHAPPRGATASAMGGFTTKSYFNSRPSARGDGADDHQLSAAQISIHAPPRGATRGRMGNRHSAYDFNSRPSARGDGLTSALMSPARTFQFTPLREGRRAEHGGCNADVDDFNSRPSARGDDALEQAKEAGYISIHAPPRGATAKDMQFLQIFCSTLTNQHGLTIVPGNLSRLFW